VISPARRLAGLPNPKKPTVVRATAGVWGRESGDHIRGCGGACFHVVELPRRSRRLEHNQGRSPYYFPTQNIPPPAPWKAGVIGKRARFLGTSKRILRYGVDQRQKNQAGKDIGRLPSKSVVAIVGTGRRHLDLVSVPCKPFLAGPMGSLSTPNRAICAGLSVRLHSHGSSPLAFNVLPCSTIGVCCFLLIFSLRYPPQIALPALVFVLTVIEVLLIF